MVRQFMYGLLVLLLGCQCQSHSENRTDWSKLNNFVSPRYGVGMIVSPPFFKEAITTDRFIIAMGGTSDSEAPALSDSWTHSIELEAPWSSDISTPTWSGRSDFGVASLLDGTIVLAGGQDESGGISKNDMHVRQTDGKWVKVTENAPWKARVGHRMTTCPDGSVIMAGGGNTRDGSFIHEYNDVWRLTGNMTHGWIWTQLTADGVAPWRKRWLFGLTCLSDNSVILAGGQCGFTYLHDVWRLESHEGGSGNWTQLEDAPWSPRSQFGFVRMPDDTILLAGGLDADDCWSLRDASSSERKWVQEVSFSFGPRDQFGMVGLLNNTVVIAGGSYLNQGLHVYGDVWSLRIK